MERKQETNKNTGHGEAFLIMHNLEGRRRRREGRRKKKRDEEREGNLLISHLSILRLESTNRVSKVLPMVNAWHVVRTYIK